MKQRSFCSMAPLFVVAGMLAQGCASPEPVSVRSPKRENLCRREVLAKRAVEFDTRNLSPETWYGLLLSNYDGKTGRTFGRPRDCSGQSLNIDNYRIKSCEAGPLWGDRPIPRSDRLTADRIVRQAVNEKEELVWLMTHVDEQNNAVGPIARVKWRPNALVVEPLGTLAAHRNGVQLRVMGPNDSILAVESDNCAAPGKDCKRELRLRFAVDGRYVDLPMVEHDRSCKGDFRVALDQEMPVVSDKRCENYLIHRSLRDSASGPGIMEAWRAETMECKSNRAKSRGRSSGQSFRRLTVREDIPMVLVEPGILQAFVNKGDAPNGPTQAVAPDKRARTAATSL